MKPADARPPLRVRALQTLAALLLIAVVLTQLPIFTAYCFNHFGVIEFLSLRDLIYVGVRIFAMLLLFIAASDKSIRIGVSGLLIMHFLNPSNIFLNFLCLFLLIYFWSVLLQNRKMSSRRRVWVVFCLITVIYTIAWRLFCQVEDDQLYYSHFGDYSMWQAYVMTVFVVAGLWKFCHSELFAGNYSPEPVQKELFSPLNRYMAAAVIVPVVFIACYYFCTSCLPDVFGMNWMQNF